MRAAEPPESTPRQVLPADAAMAAVVLLLGLFLAGTGGSMVQRWRSSSARHAVPRVRRPAGPRGEHGRPHRDGLVGHVLGHCRRGGAPGTVREGTRRLGCRKVRPGFHAPPRPGRRRTPAAHRTARHGLHRAAAPGRQRRRSPAAASRLAAAPASAAGPGRRLRPRWRSARRPGRRPSAVAARSPRSSNPARWRAGRGAPSSPPAGDRGDSPPRGFAVGPVRGPAGTLRLRRRHRLGLAPDLPGQQGHHRRQPPSPAARPGTPGSAGALNPTATSATMNHRDPHQPPQQQRKPHERHAPPPRRRGTPPVHVIRRAPGPGQRSSGGPRGHSAR